MTTSSQSGTGAVAVFVLAIAGQAAALAITDAPPYAVYQHYLPWAHILSGQSVAAWVLALQALVVSALAWQLRARIAAAFGRAAPTRSLLIVLACAAFSAAVPTMSVSRFAGELMLASTIALISLANLLVAAALIPDGVLEKASTWVNAHITLGPGDTPRRPWDRLLPLAVAAWIAIASGIANVVVMERMPHIDDSVSYYFQAKYHGAGRLHVPPPPDADSFQMDEINIDADKWYGYGSPGWPMVLAIGAMAGAPWIVNPILGGLLILVGHALILRRAGRGTANLTVLLLAFSPWLIFMSAEFMAHPLTALLATTTALAFDYGADRGPRWVAAALAAGIALGLLALTRPVEAVFTVGALGLTAAIDRRFTRALPAAIVAGILAAGISSLIFPFNRTLTGRATYTPQMAWTDRRWGPGVDRLGFGPDIGIPGWRNIDPLPGHGPADVVLNLNKNAFMANVELFGWATGSLLPVWLALAIGRWRRGDALMLASIGTFVVGYSAWWFSGGPDLGPRYWYPLLVPMAAITARGAQMIVARMEGAGSSISAARVGTIILAATVSAAVTMVPWRAVTKHYRYREVGGGVRSLAIEHGFEHDSLVFVRSQARSDYQSAFNLNPPALTGPATIYARDAGAEARARVVARFPKRMIWVIARDESSPRGTFKVVAGPLPAGTIPQ